MTRTPVHNTLLKRRTIKSPHKLIQSSKNPDESSNFYSETKQEQQTLINKKNQSNMMMKSYNRIRNKNPSVSTPISLLKSQNPVGRNHGNAVIIDDDSLNSPRSVSRRTLTGNSSDKPSTSKSRRVSYDVDHDVVDISEEDVVTNDRNVDVINVEDYGVLMEGPVLLIKKKRSKMERKRSGLVVIGDIDSLGEEVSTDDGDVIEVKVFSCELCADEKSLYEKFAVKGCDHVYCIDCVRNYVSSKLDDGVSVIGCPVPGCCGSLDPEYCRWVVSDQIFNRWGVLLCESLIPANEKFYCPFKDCSAMLVADGDEVVTSSECPYCFRLFCAQCRVVWHEGIVCEEVQKMNEADRSREDLLLLNLAKNKSWKRCPACKIYVERTQGCLYMKCRCGVAFCYSCGNVNNNHQWHNCSNCNKTY